MTTLPVLVLSVLLMLAGCDGPSPSDRYLADVRDTAGFPAHISDRDLSTLGFGACSEIGHATVSREMVIDQVVESAASFGTATVTDLQARTITDAAYAHLCPEKTFGTATPQQTPEQAFLADVDDTPNLTRTTPDDQLISLGRTVCEAVGAPGISRAQIVNIVETNGFPAAGEIIVGAAERNLCPGKTFSAAPAAPAPTAGPAASMTQGTYEVGVDVAPGKYKTAGSERCYWERMRDNDGSLGDIIDNNYGPGQQVTTLREGEYFSTRGCGSWTKSG